MSFLQRHFVVLILWVVEYEREWYADVWRLHRKRKTSSWRVQEKHLGEDEGVLAAGSAPAQYGDTGAVSELIKQTDSG